MILLGFPGIGAMMSDYASIMRMLAFLASIPDQGRCREPDVPTMAGIKERRWFASCAARGPPVVNYEL